MEVRLWKHTVRVGRVVREDGEEVVVGNTITKNWAGGPGGAEAKSIKKAGVAIGHRLANRSSEDQ